MQGPNPTPMLSGIDALYYFAQSGAFYDRFFESIMEKIEEKKAYFDSLNFAYENSDIIIPINGIDMIYSGAGRDGFQWFGHEFFRAGFKDSEKNPSIHNIRIQLNAVGIYTLGIKSLIEYINSKLLDEVTSGYYPITRIDLNTFVQHDFKYLRKEYILSKKKNHSANISERSSGYELETYYVGKKPFLLRIYNKKAEMKSASEIKREIMLNHFGVNGLDLKGPIFNVEFEMHREYLRQYGIDTIEDALARAEQLFTKACELIRLIDPDTLSASELKANRKRAKTLQIWQEIKEGYSIDAFMQVDTPLEKVEQISSRYSLEDAERSIKRIITRLLVHGNHPTLFYFLDVLQKARDELELRRNAKELHPKYPPESFEEELKALNRDALESLERRLELEMQQTEIGDLYYEELSYHYTAVFNEFVRRGLRRDF
ncbi:hypothetical protein [Sulfurimonas diazotrophicus]|uniref:Uncharacterized protein n=1 Tax=Sulfurimonas diazotrophicus TaxID=3131939 RepID=A0ABZ3H7K7_9BACT